MLTKESHKNTRSTQKNTYRYLNNKKIPKQPIKKPKNPNQRGLEINKSLDVETKTKDERPRNR